MSPRTRLRRSPRNPPPTTDDTAAVTRRGALASTLANTVVNALVVTLVVVVSSTMGPGTTTPTSVTGPAAHAQGRVDTSVRGWSSQTVRLAAGGHATFALRILSPGRRGSRAVLLLRRTSADQPWSTVARTRSASSGGVRLSYTAPTAAGRLQLAVRVPATSTRRGVTTRPRPVVVPSSPPTGSTGGATSAPSPDSPAGQVLDLVNQARSQARSCGGTQYAAAAPVTWDGRLGAAAQDHAADMAEHNYFSHISPDGDGPGERITAANYTWTTWRENIAAGQRTAQDVMAAWLGSPDHCADIMAADVHELGVGHASDPTSDYGSYWVQDFATHS